VRLGGRKSETQVQFTFETKTQYLKNELKRARGKFFSYLWFRFRWNYYPRWRIVPSFPLNIDIEVSSRCNLRCDHCFRQYMDIGEDDLMPFEMYKRIVDECARYHLFTLKFSMRGEPTCHPQLPQMVRYAKEKGIKEVWINTHGGNITTRLATELLKAHPDWITVSFDGLGQMYESIRKPLRYRQSLEKLKLLRLCRDRYSPRTLLNAQTLWSAIKHDPQEYLDTIGPIVDRISCNPDMNFKQIILVPDEKFVCPRLWQRLAITSRGDFLKCPSDFQKEEVLGNIAHQSIKETWDKFQQRHRAQHLAHRKNQSPVCRKCHHGAKKIKRTLVVDDERYLDGFDFQYTRQFEGVGLNRGAE